jgi:hypothetical protein
MTATSGEGSTLVADGVQLVASVESYIARCEARLTYRREHGRTLSKAHVDALDALKAQVVALTGRLDSLLGPDIGKLYEQFNELQRRLGVEEEQDNGEQ